LCYKQEVSRFTNNLDLEIQKIIMLKFNLVISKRELGGSEWHAWVGVIYQYELLMFNKKISSNYEKR
jgi:hypothetical protein